MKSEFATSLGVAVVGGFSNASKGGLPLVLTLDALLNLHQVGAAGVNRFESLVGVASRRRAARGGWR